MNQHTNNLIVGQGLAGTALAWKLLDAGQSVILVDRGESATASRVSAGLVTPWTGRRMTQSSDYQQDWEEALSFYRSVEQQVGRTFFREQTMLRIFVNRSDETTFEQRLTEGHSEGLARWQGQLQADGSQFSGCTMLPAARLDVPAYLQASIDFFSQRGQWYQHELKLPQDLVLGEDHIQIPSLQLSADRVIFCQGAVENPWFAGIPNNRSRGDVINIQIDSFQPNDVVHHSVWLAPERDGSVTAGATYDWKYLDNEPTAAGRRELLTAIKRFVEGPIRVNHHTAAVRPTMKDYQPVVGQHAEHPRLAIFTGLGSRGVLTAPRFARLLTDSLCGESDLPPQIRPDRLRPVEKRQSLTQLAQDRIAQVIRAGDIVVDATVGNGFDTVFLARQVGQAGRVFGFDLQQQAIQSTQKRLAAAQLENVQLLLTSHSEFENHVDGTIAAAMFNLGYLPRSDHAVVTMAHTTLAALEQMTRQLAPGGIITVLAYRGHDGGPKEAEAVRNWLQAQNDCTLERIDSQPPRPTSPVLFVLTKEVVEQ